MDYLRTPNPGSNNTTDYHSRNTRRDNIPNLGNSSRYLEPCFVVYAFSMLSDPILEQHLAAATSRAYYLGAILRLAVGFFVGDLIWP